MLLTVFIAFIFYPFRHGMAGQLGRGDCNASELNASGSAIESRDWRSTTHPVLFFVGFMALYWTFRYLKEGHHRDTYDSIVEWKRQAYDLQPKREKAKVHYVIVVVLGLVIIAVAPLLGVLFWLAFACYMYTIHAKREE
jgi:hypothetical protein